MNLELARVDSWHEVIAREAETTLIGAARKNCPHPSETGAFYMPSRFPMRPIIPSQVPSRKFRSLRGRSLSASRHLIVSRKP